MCADVVAPHARFAAAKRRFSRPIRASAGSAGWRVPPGGGCAGFETHAAGPSRSSPCSCSRSRSSSFSFGWAGGGGGAGSGWRSTSGSTSRRRAASTDLNDAELRPGGTSRATGSIRGSRPAQSRLELRPTTEVSRRASTRAAAPASTGRRSAAPRRPCRSSFGTTAGSPSPRSSSAGSAMRTPPPS